MWQERRTQWHARGLEVVTVALDVNVDDARPFIEAAGAEHPSVIDSTHVTGELFGFVNVPNAVWIDENGMIVRAAEPAQPGTNSFTESFRTIDLSTLPPDIAEIVREARKIHIDSDRYVAMVDDWITRGADSPYVHAPDEVVARSGARSTDEATAAAEFELGEWLHRNGDHAAAIMHWRNAHRLYPENWTYKRQAWNFEDPIRQGRTDAYDSCWYEDVKKIGAENYYPDIIP